MRIRSIIPVLLLIICTGCAKDKQKTSADYKEEGKLTMSTTLDTATFAAGCFWCVEAVFQRVEGVISVKSGYSGGSVPNPSYELVCTGRTGHAEACQIVYDSAKVSFVDLLQIFWGTHDPTTLNKQGADVGTQYRSAIFYHTDEQQRLALEYKEKLDKSGVYQNPVVTEISPLGEFYPAEDYHQDYYNEHQNQSYCSFVITPKLEKFKKVFSSKVKAGGK